MKSKFYKYSFKDNSRVDGIINADNEDEAFQILHNHHSDIDLVDIREYFRLREFDFSNGFCPIYHCGQ